MNLALLAEEAAKPKKLDIGKPGFGLVDKPKVLKLTAPSGRVYRMTWQKATPPTQADIDAALEEAGRQEDELSSLVGDYKDRPAGKPLPMGKPKQEKGVLDNLGGVLLKGGGNPLAGMSGTGAAPMDDYTKASVSAGVKNVNKIVKDTKESFTEAIPSLDKIPGGRLAQRIAPALVGPGDKGYAGHIAGALADTVTAPLDVTADAANFIAKGEWQAAANILLKTGAAALPLKGAAPAIASVAGKTKAGRSLAVGQAMKQTVKSGIGKVDPNLAAQTVGALIRAGATEDEAIQAVGAAIRTNEASGVEFIAKAESSNAETQGLLKTLMRGGIISENRVEGGLRIPKKGDWDQVSADFPSTKRFTGQTEESALKKLQAELGKAKIVSRNEDEIVFDNGMTATVKSRFIPAKTSKDWSGGHYEYSIDVPMETGTEFQLSRKYRRFGQYMWEPTEYYPAGTKQANEPGVAELAGKVRVVKDVQKEPWQMTREEFTRPRGMSLSAYDTLINRKEPSWRQDDFNKAEAYHKWAVIEPALQEGKPVPAEVLADYPDLAAKYVKSTPEAVPTPLPVDDVRPPSQTTSRYGANYGTPVQGSGKRPGYAMERPAVTPPVEPPPVKPVEPKTVAKAEPQKSPILVDQKNMGDVLGRLGRAIPDKDPKTVQGMVDSARKTYNGEDAQRIANRAARGGVNLTDDETLKLGLRVKDLELQRDALLKRGDPADAALLDEIDRQMVEVAEAGYRSGTTWAQTGIARQVELARQAADKSANLKARAKIAIESSGGKMTETEAKQLDLLARRVETLANTLDTLKKQVKEEWRPKAQTGKRLTRAQSLGNLRRLGIPTAEAGELVGSGAGKQSGAITLPDNIFKDDKVRKAIRDLMRSYYDDGAKSIDDVLDRMRKDMPGLENDDLYALISDKFRAQKVESNIAKLEANRFIRKTQAAASARMKPVLGRALKAVYDEVKTVQRAFQTSLDTGYALIQGHKAIATNPGKVAKSFGESLKMIPSINTQARFDRHLAEIQARPMYARAKKAGIQFADLGDGSESDFFGGGVSRKIPGIFKSEAMFDAYKNELRMSLFEAFAKNVPDDAEQMKSIAELVNVMTGTATGTAGDAAKRLGGAFYAPSYEVSKWQFMMGKPLIDAIAKHGIKSTAAKEAAKVYAKNAAVWVGGVWAAKEFNDRMKKRNPNYKGYDINTDARSADFGKLTLPNGMQFDLFGKSFSPLKDFAQLIWGTESRKGNFTPSNQFGAFADKVGTYTERKMSPVYKTVAAALTKGTVYDFDEEKDVPISVVQLAKDSAPMGLKSIFTNWKKVPEEFRPLLFLELMGVNTGQKKPQSGKPAPKMGLPPGLSKMLGPE